ncbi:MAG: MATE family efflux transporter [Campylobacter sp.]
MGVGFSVIIARCVGAGDFEQVKFYTRKIMILVYLLQIFTVGAVLILLEPILNLYNLSSQASAMTSQVV